jgi:hypothetical protein
VLYEIFKVNEYQLKNEVSNAARVRQAGYVKQNLADGVVPVNGHKFICHDDFDK